MAAMNNISELKPFKSMWKVKVKIIRLWRQYSAAGGETIEMVLVDSRGDKIHGTVKKDEVGQFVHVLQQEQTKVLINFAVTHSGGSYRSTKHPYKVVFLPTTRVRICEALPNNLTELEPVIYRDLLNGKLDPDFLVDAAEGVEPTIDEIKKYFDARYLSACELTWRILAFPTQYRSTPVEKLTFHLEGEKPVVYKSGDIVESVLAQVHLMKTMFLAWFDCCELYPEAREITYAEMPTRFVYDAKQKVWNPRKKGFAIGRLAPASPSSSQYYFLRVLLNKVKGPRCYDDIKMVKGIILPSYEDACYELGLLDDDKEYTEGLKECSFWASSGYVRHLFASMLLSGCLSMPKLVWESCTRVKSRKGLKILITDKEKKPQDSTLNVVFKEVFQNLFEKLQ